MKFLHIYKRFIPNELKSALLIITDDTPGHVQPGYTLQGTTGDQCTIAFSVHCQVLILQPSETVHISGSNPRYYRHRRLSVMRDLNLQSRG